MNMKSCWKPEKNDRYNLLHFTESKRISQPIADLIKTVAVKPYNDLFGINNVCIKPIIIAYRNR